jgi:hypothetical protein
VEAAVLFGHAVLVVEDEPLIAFEISEDLRRAGATPSETLLADYPNLSAVIVDFRLSDGDAGSVCELIPFVLYSGDLLVNELGPQGVYVPKSAKTSDSSPPSSAYWRMPLRPPWTRRRTGTSRLKPSLCSTLESGTWEIAVPDDVILHDAERFRESVTWRNCPPNEGRRHTAALGGLGG